MKVGDLIKKTAGALDVDETGIMLSVYTNCVGNTIVRVLTPEKVKQWWAEYVEVIKQ